MMWRKCVGLAGCVLAALAWGCERKPAGAAATNVPPTGVKVALGFHPKAGSKSTVVMDAKQVITQSPPGAAKQVQNQETYAEMEYGVQGVDGAGVSTVRVTYQRMKTTTPAASGDSAGAGTSAADRIYKALCGKGFDVDFAVDGEVKEVRGLAPLYDSLGAALPELTAAQRDQFLTQMKTQFGEAAMKTQLASKVYPEKPVDNGDVWQKVSRVDTFGMEVTSDYKLLEHNATTARIGVTGQLKPIPAAGPLHVGNMTLRYELSGTQRGALQMDVAEGWVRKTEMVQDFSGTVEASGPGIAGTQRWPIRIESTTTMEMR